MRDHVSGHCFMQINDLTSLFQIVLINVSLHRGQIPRVPWDVPEINTMLALSLLTTVGRDGRDVQGGIIFRLWGHLPDDTLYQSLSRWWWENAIFFNFCMMTPICRLHLPSLLTQAGPKRKTRFQVFILSISSIPFSQNGAGGRRCWIGLSVYSRLFHLDGLPQHSRLGSNYSEHIRAWLWRSGMLSPLCWKIHAAMWREGEKVWRRIYPGAAIIKECFLWFEKMDTPCPFPFTKVVQFEQPSFILHRQQWEQMVRGISMPW